MLMDFPISSPSNIISDGAGVLALAIGVEDKRGLRL